MVDGRPAQEARRAGGRAERAIRITTVIAVATVAAVAGFVSYRHMRGVALQYGEDAMTSAVLPFSVDGLIVAASMTMLADRRAGRRRSWLSYTLLMLGACASLAANVLHAEPTTAARIIAGWPPLALLGSYELLMRQIHPTSRRTARQQAAAAAPADVPTVDPQADGPAAGGQPGGGQPVPAPGSIPPQRQRMPAVGGDFPAGTPAPAATAPAATDNAVADNVVADSTVAVVDLSVTAPMVTPAPATAQALDPAPGRTPAPGPAVPTGASATVPTDGPASTAGAGSAGGVDTVDSSVKREAIIRALDETGGSATAAVTLLGRWGITVSKSWVYQVRKETRHADVQTGPLVMPTHRAHPASRGRRRGMAPDRPLVAPRTTGG
ncbi:conserved membrane hypothetical protein [Parafrankia sp. Ea1.12]|uniref:DUF2637 domain-containing protein n=1 Tax=Parafrankia sp. Ea1.12 TaxID=573499 RepID=UPI000DA43DD7|nr:DUF2637 domain-containing protein [Parafrankia sp. Ea1.12]SQE00140.1 conserved membrane hypothetical protein [Parafrankia sp. Ea1.12]